MDMLESLLEKQKVLQERLGYNFDKMTDKERAEYIKEYQQHCDHELHEMLAEIPFFKSWKKYTDNAELNEACWEAAQEEFIDALHFFLNMALALRFDANLLYYMFVDKNDINHGRQEDHVNYKPCVEGNTINDIMHKAIDLQPPEIKSDATITINNIAKVTGRSVEEVTGAVIEQLQKRNARGI